MGNYFFLMRKLAWPQKLRIAIYLFVSHKYKLKYNRKQCYEVISTIFFFLFSYIEIVKEALNQYVCIWEMLLYGIVVWVYAVFLHMIGITIQ